MMIATLPTSEELSPLSLEMASVCHALLHSPYRCLRSVTCDLVRDTLVLRGTVTTYYIKQLAQTVALRSASTLVVRNDIHVSRS
jgi:hypothetical protein